MSKVLILAAGKGSRMNSDLPKVLFPVNGRPIVEYLIESVLASKVDKQPIMVVSPDNQKEIKAALSNFKLDYAVQESPLGTGHAVLSAQQNIPETVNNVLVFYGDNPFLSSESIRRLVDSHGDKNLSMMTIKIDDFLDWRQNFYHWGRIVRSQDGFIEKIVEFKDASDEEREIKELNPALFCFNRKWLFDNINNLKNNNKQKEYYLTDLIKIAFEQKIKINSLFIEAQEAIGVNTPQDLEVLRKLFSF